MIFDPQGITNIKGFGILNTQQWQVVKSDYKCSTGLKVVNLKLVEQLQTA
ncbi:hypothetical protein RintRC_6914 [Richelia intracellularis]|nr:hypothetical protein RintRC_6914 [Richelia intracellularis]